MRNRLFIIIFFLALSLCCEAQNTTVAGPPKKAKTTIKKKNTVKKKLSVSRQEHEGYITFTIGGVSFDMVRVDGGTFMMGTDEKSVEIYEGERPSHQVTLSSYYIGRTEVSQALWKAVMGSNPSKVKGNNMPVETVSWNDCQEFISKLNILTGETFSLPTEAQWEFAARGGNKSHDYKYSGSDNIDDVAWCAGHGTYCLHGIGLKQPNELGLYDMSGNVVEWCLDRYASYSSSPQTNPIGSSEDSKYVFRGGSWNGTERYCRVTYRYYIRPDYRFGDYGLRLAISKQE